MKQTVKYKVILQIVNGRLVEHDETSAPELLPLQIYWWLGSSLHRDMAVRSCRSGRLLVVRVQYFGARAGRGLTATRLKDIADTLMPAKHIAHARALMVMLCAT